MDVGDRVLGLPARPGLGDDVPFDDVRPPADAERSQVRQRHLVLPEGDGHRRAVRGHRPGECHLAGGRSPDIGRALDGDVDTPVLTCGIRIATHEEAAEHFAVGRPCPCPRGRAGAERPAEHEPEAHAPFPSPPVRCPSSEHESTVPTARVSGNAK